MGIFIADYLTDNKAVFEEDARHIAKTLRMSEGDMLHAADGMGNVMDCRITSLSQHKVVAEIEYIQPSLSEPDIRITLYQGNVRSNKFDFVVQKAVELGAYAVAPLMLRRCEAGEVDSNRLARYNKISREACKQCGRAIVPRVEPSCRIEDIFQKGHDLILCPWEEAGDNTLKTVLAAHSEAKDIGVIIGPEGGIEPAEIRRITDGGGIPVTLGKRILRTETAGLAVLSVILIP